MKAIHLYKHTGLSSLMDKKNNVFNLGNNKAQAVGKVLPQTGKIISLPKDKARFALPPGKRVSRTGKIYWETRFNRSDSPPKKV